MTPPGPQDRSDPPAAVVASFRERRLLEACLEALLPQCRDLGGQAVVARAAPADEVSELSKSFPDVRFVQLPPGSPLPMIRGRGLAAAVGDPIALTEDHCAPAPDWLATLTAARRNGGEVLGGGMAHSPSGRLIDWAAYFSEYGFFSWARPHRGGWPLITGANVGYSRRLAAEVADWMIAGAWENVVHDRLAARGSRAEFLPSARVFHQHSYRIGAFCRDRFAHGVAYARDRVAERGSNRWMRAALTPILPFVLLRRIAVASWDESPMTFVKVAPLTLTFLSAWAAGEAVGYLQSSTNAPRSQPRAGIGGNP